MFLNIIILPFITFIICGIMGRVLGVRGVSLILLINFILLIMLSSLLLYENFMIGNTISTEPWSTIFYRDLFCTNIYIYLDDLSQLMLFMIIGITSIVLLYTYDYMINDAHIIRFYLYILLFVFFMIILITTSSLPILFIGWEGVGVSSFLLISFWYTRFQAQLGALLALLMNRIGDTAFLLGLFLSISWIGTWDIIAISSCSNVNWDFIIIAFFIAAMAKSAQIYLHIWLPYSMEGKKKVL